VLAVDQTRESLQFLTKRLSNEDLPNVTCIRDDLRVIDLEGVADVAVVNGVLEWVAEPDPIELGRFYGKEVERSPTVTQNPDRIQDDFLRRVRKSLRNGGRLMLAIENRYDYSQFIGKRDPHSNLFFTSFAPRHISDQLSRLILKRPYVNFLHSFSGLNKKLLKAGFHEVDLYAVFPNYRFPDLILPYVGGLRDYRRTLGQSPSRRRKLVSVVEAVLMKSLKARFLAPSIIAIAKV
jgi:SAM-dependent methyltransferase